MLETVLSHYLRFLRLLLPLYAGSARDEAPKAGDHAETNAAVSFFSKKISNAGKSGGSAHLTDQERAAKAMTDKVWEKQCRCLFFSTLSASSLCQDRLGTIQHTEQHHANKNDYYSLINK